jgi:hypothetical protein
MRVFRASLNARVSIIVPHSETWTEEYPPGQLGASKAYYQEIFSGKRLILNGLT